MIGELQSIMTQNLIVFMSGVFLFSMALTACGTAVLIPVLRKNKAKQTIHEDAPDSHKGKSGTPTMGGIAILFAVLITCTITAILFESPGIDIIVTLASFVVFAFLGFVDDFNKIINKRNLGLTAKQKFFIQCFIALDISVIYVILEGMNTEIQIPFTHLSCDLGYWYILFMSFAIVAMVNSVNLTDGLDGLASGVSLIVCLFLALATVSYSIISSNWFLLALSGACAGFLIFNKNPAKIFMGDTGSLAIGGGITVAAFYANVELVMVIAGLVYVVEALSDIIQVASYKLRNGKRVFKMAPLHHHFELIGWSERKIVATFMTVTLVLCIICSFSI